MHLKRSVLAVVGQQEHLLMNVDDSVQWWWLATAFIG
jgi:hypothetical protein